MRTAKTMGKRTQRRGRIEYTCEGKARHFNIEPLKSREAQMQPMAAILSPIFRKEYIRPFMAAPMAWANCHEDGQMNGKTQLHLTIGQEFKNQLKKIERTISRFVLFVVIFDMFMYNFGCICQV